MNATDLEGGFIILARKIFSNPILRDAERFRAWVWLLAEAAWKPMRIRVVAGRTRALIDLQRGQLSHSLRFMAEAFGWSTKRVRTFLDDLKMDEMITIEAGHAKGTQTGRQAGTGQNIITICNYDTYQTDRIQEGTQTGNQQLENGHKEERTNKRIDISPSKKNLLGWPSDGFERWYSGYPKKVEKVAARKAFDKVQAAGDVPFDKLLAARDRYALQVKGKDQQFTKGPAVWLNKGCYLDEAPAVPGSAIIAAPSRDPKTFSESEWRTRLQDFDSSGQWPEKFWGPRPGTNGCLVPQHLLDRPAGPLHA